MAHKKSFLTEEGEALELVCAQDGFERIPCDMAGDIAGPRGRQEVIIKAMLCVCAGGPLWPQMEKVVFHEAVVEGNETTLPRLFADTGQEGEGARGPIHRVA